MIHTNDSIRTPAEDRTVPWTTIVDDDGRVWPVPAGGSDDDEDDDEDGDTVESLKAELERIKRESRKWERRAKSNSTERDAAVAELERIKREGPPEDAELRQKLADAESARETAEAARLKLQVALKSAPEGMPLEKVASLADRLRGDDEDALVDDAEALFADFAPASSSDGDGSPPTPGGDGKPTPTPKLKPGTGGGEGDSFGDIDELADGAIKKAAGR